MRAGDCQADLRNKTWQTTNGTDNVVKVAFGRKNELALAA
jgi:hypothetical protein